MPLAARLRNYQAKVLGQLEDEKLISVWILQEKRISPPILALPSKEGWYNPETDVYDRRIGCVLLQKQDDNFEKPIGYWPNILSDRERNLDTTD